MTDTERIVKAITNFGDKINKTMVEGFRAANANLTDCASSLRILDKQDKAKLEGWKDAIGENAELPGKEYDWVLVKIRDLGPAHAIYGIPHIAKYRPDGVWWAQEWDAAYKSPEVPFEVVSWRPIPDDEAVVMYADGEEIGRCHSYE